MRSFHRFAIIFLAGMASVLTPETVLAEAPVFFRPPLTAGRQMLTENSYTQAYFFGTANFSPELSYPISLYYKSELETSGMFGKAWLSPQLESSFNENLWHSPWGERISFPDISKRYAVDSGRIIGINELEGWEFIYKNTKLDRIQSPGKRSIEFEYENNRLVAVRQQGRAFIAIDYQGSTVSRLEINSIKFQIAYTSDNRLASIQRADLVPVQYGYSEEGYLSSIKHGDYTEEFVLDNASGFLRQDADFTYDVSGTSVKLTDKAGYSQKRQWQDHIFTVVDKAGRTEKYEFIPTFDPAYPGKLLRISDDKDKTLLSCKYDENGKLLERTDRLGNRLLLSYNALGLPAALFQQAADSQLRIPLEKIEYNTEKLPVKVVTTSEDGSTYREIRLLYDTNRQVSILERDNHSFRISYNPYGYPVSLAAKNGVIFGVRYDDFNRPLGKVSQVAEFFSYNDAGLITEIRNQYEPEKVASFLRIEYDALGNPIHYRDHKGRSVRYEYNADGTLESSISPTGTRTSYLYDALGNLAQVTDPNGHLIRFISGSAGMAKQITAENQVNEQIYDDLGRVVRLRSYFADQEAQADRDISYEYDEYDRVKKIDFGNGYVQENAYDQWGHISRIERRSPTERRVAEMKYDHFSRMMEKTETVYLGRKLVDTFHYRYEYNNRNQKVFLGITHNGSERKFLWNHDENGLLVSQQTGRDKILYTYDNGKIKTQTINGKELAFACNRFGLLERKTLAGVADLKYFYDGDGTLTGREFNGKRVNYQYDPLGQLLAVVDAGGKELERYEYDPSGNILKKIIGGKTSTFAYDKANQLKNAVMDGKKLNHRYDAAGRLVSDGESDFEYAWLNSVVKAGKEVFSYHIDGHLAKTGDERFLWDDLALAIRGDMVYLNENAPTGGNPVLAGKEIIFTDQLGSSLGFQNGDKFTAIERTAFGASSISKEYDFFTGKPYANGMGYKFLFRNYQPQYGKWSSADPLGYPDGWNCLSYVNNEAFLSIDSLGGAKRSFLQSAWNSLKTDAANTWIGMKSGIYAVGAATNAAAGNYVTAAYLSQKSAVTLYEGLSGNKIGTGSGNLVTEGLIYTKNAVDLDISDNAIIKTVNIADATVGGVKSIKDAVQWSLGMSSSITTADIVWDISTNTMFLAEETVKYYSSETQERFSASHATYEDAERALKAQERFSVSHATYEDAERSQKVTITSSENYVNTNNAGIIGSNQSSVDDDAHIIRSSAEAANAEKNKPVAVVDPQNPPGKDYTIKVPPIPMIKLEIWDYAAEDGDTVEVLHNGKVVMSERTIYNKPFYVSVPAEGNFQVRGIHDGGGGITYAVRVVETKETLKNETASQYANRYTMEKMSLLEYLAKIGQDASNDNKKKK